MTDPSDISWLRILFAFSIVLGLMAGLGALLKYVAMRGFLVSIKPGERRLRVVESLPLDAKRRCVIVSCDGREHLLLLGPQGDTVVEANLSSVPSQTTP